MYRALIYLVVCLSATSCFTPTEEIEAVGYDSTYVEGPEPISIDSTVLKVRSKQHIFSDVAHPDTFKLTVKGASMTHALVNFEIINFKGEVIYSQQFASSFLMDFGAASSDSLEQEAFITKRINEFFTEASFIQPAIAVDMVFDPNYSGKENWNEIKADRSSIGFIYQIGKEDGRRIAYSKRQRKVVMYFNCC